MAGKRWDAAGVAAFALAEMLGGDDAPTAAAALMLHQVCSALETGGKAPVEWSTWVPRMGHGVHECRLRAWRYVMPWC